MMLKKLMRPLETIDGIDKFYLNIFSPLTIFFSRLKTGDQFILNENGYGKIVGRMKDMIIRGGENIFPKEIEDFLNTHENILEAHVVGIYNLL